MECGTIDSKLTSFYFGAVEENDRNACERHMLSCPHCVRAFLEIKRNIEAEPAISELPGPSVREGVRERLFAKLRPAVPQTPRARIFQSAVAFTMLLAVIGGFSYLRRNPQLFKGANDSHSIETEIDTARDSAFSLNRL